MGLENHLSHKKSLEGLSVRDASFNTGTAKAQTVEDIFARDFKSCLIILLNVLPFTELQEEKAKRESRAARFATSGAVGQEYTPIVDEEDARRRERAERFGTEFNAVDHSGLKEQGVCRACYKIDSGSSSKTFP